MEIKIRSRNHGLDLLKYLCAFLVVCTHMSYLGKEWLEPLTRFAVPVFFMITGYFYEATRSRGRELAQIRKILKLTVLSNILFFLWSVLWTVIQGQPLTTYFRSLADVKVWLDFLLLNDAPFSGHLWYLSALLYVLVLVWLFEKKWDRKKLYPLIPLLLAANLLLGTYAYPLFGLTLPRIYSRNFLFAGLPFFLLGDYFSTRTPKLSTPVLAVTAILAAVGTHLENTWLLSGDQLVNKDLFVSTIFLTASLFLLTLRHADVFERRVPAALSRFAAPLTVYIYVFHPIIDAFTSKAVEIIGHFLPLISRAYLYCSPVIVFIACTVFAWVVSKRKGKKA